MCVIVLSGPVCAGKTSLARALHKFGFRSVSTRALLLTFAPQDGLGRLELQHVGEQLDAERGGDWVCGGGGARASRQRADRGRLGPDA